MMQMYNLNYSFQSKKNIFNYALTLIRIIIIIHITIKRVSLYKFKTLSYESQETLERIANALEVPIWQLFVSPQELQRENHSLVCPKCGTPLELKIKE